MGSHNTWERKLFALYNDSNRNATIGVLLESLLLFSLIQKMTNSCGVGLRCGLGLPLSAILIDE